MKKIIALLLVMAMVFAFAACGNESANEPAAKEDADKTADFKAGFIFLHDENSTYDLKIKINFKIKKVIIQYH